MSPIRLFVFSSFLLIVVACHSYRGKTQTKEIERTLLLSINYITGQNDLHYHSLLQKQADPTTRYVSQRWSPAAFKARMIAAEAIICIDSLHQNMTTSGSFSFEDEKSLFNTLVTARRNLLNVFPDSLDPNGYFLAKDRESLQRYLPLLRGFSDQGQSESSFNEWSANLFQGDTAMSTLALDKLKIDVRLSENVIATYCDKNAVSTVDRYDRFEPLISLNTSIAAPGDTIELKAGIGAYSESARPKITIDGSWTPINPNGVAVYMLRASRRPGPYSIPVTIEFTKPDGQRDTITQVVHYRVRGMPSQ